MNHFREKADEFSQTFTHGDNIVTVEMSIKDYLHEKGLYVSRTYFVIQSRYGLLLDLVLLNSFKRKDFESDIILNQPTNLELVSSENSVSQSQEELRDQCNRSVLPNDTFTEILTGMFVNSKFGNPKLGLTYQK